MVSLGVEQANGNRMFAQSYFPTQSIQVDPTGHGNFLTIQSAIDSIPSNNKFWTAINVKAGTYREKVKIPIDKPYILLQGEGISNTFVEWDDHDNTAQSPTFYTMADNIVVKYISFKNTYNDPPNKNPVVPAVAALISGDKCYFYNVGFYGFQDTLWDDQGRHYFKRCIIQGAVDFIFGAGQSLYEESYIVVTAAALGPGISGIITAQGRTSPEDANGFIFKQCQIYGDGTTFLGRPWRAYARVLFYECSMTNIIEPAGWQPWNFVGHEDRIEFAEYGNIGPGSNTFNRVNWAKQYNGQTVNSLASLRFIDEDGWLEHEQF
ncbi:probable pectinesterase 29 [Cicer arietinum]